MSSKEETNKSFEKLEKQSELNTALKDNYELPHLEIDHENQDSPTVLAKIQPKKTEPHSEKEQQNIILNNPNQLVEIFQHILEKKNRTDEEALILYDNIKDFKFFEKVLQDRCEPESILKTVKALKYRKIKAGRTVFVEGDLSNGNMYILFSGEALMLKKSELAEVHTPITAQRINEKSDRKHRGSVREMIHRSSSDSQKFHEIPASGLQSKKEHKVKTLKVITSKNNLKVDHGNNGYNEYQSDDADSLGRESPSQKEVLDIKIEQNLAQSPVKPKEAKLAERNSVLEKQDSNSYGDLIGRITKGDHFGEQRIGPGVNMVFTVFSKTDCELLVLSAQTLNSVKNEINKQVKKILDLLVANIPGLGFISAKALVKNYFHLFEENEFFYGNHIINEGEKGDKFFLIYAGSCEVYRTIIIEESESLPINYSKIKNTFFSKTYSIREKIPLIKVKEGAIVGEEVLFSERSRYNYSIQVISDSCQVVGIKKDLFKLRFPKDVAQKIKEGYEEKKNYKDSLLCQSLEKREIYFVKGDLNTNFLTVKRSPVQDCTQSTAKINKVPSQFESIKIMTDHIAGNEITSPEANSPLILPKISKVRRVASMEPEEFNLKQKMISFSRVNLMPPKEQTRESPKMFSPSEKTNLEMLPFIKFDTEASEKQGALNEPDNISHVDHIRKKQATLGYRDIIHVYDDISPKLNLDAKHNVFKANINNANYFKFDFGRPEPLEGKKLIYAKNRALKKDKSQPLIGNSVQSSSITPVRIRGNHQISQFDGSEDPTKHPHVLLKYIDLDRYETNRSNLSSISMSLSKQTTEANTSAHIKVKHLISEPNIMYTPIHLRSLTTRPKKLEPVSLPDKIWQIKGHTQTNSALAKELESLNYIPNAHKYKLDTSFEAGESVKLDTRSKDQSHQEAEESPLPYESHYIKENKSSKRKNVLSLKTVQLSPLALLKQKFEKLQMRSKK